MCLSKFADKYTDHLYVVFRVLAGLLFAQHGLQKLFGAFGGLAGDGQAVALVSLLGLAGLIELVAGLAIALGLFTRLAALIAGVELIIAYFRAHFSQGLIPIVNGGELALLFVSAFLVLLAFGARKWSLEKAIFKKELL